MDAHDIPDCALSPISKQVPGVSAFAVHDHGRCAWRHRRTVEHGYLSAVDLEPPSGNAAVTRTRWSTLNPAGFNDQVTDSF
jgi:hypothetical protein